MRFMSLCLLFLQCIFLFTELDAVLQHLEQSTARPGVHAFGTSKSSADESEVDVSRRRVRSKRTFKMKKVWGAIGVGQFFVTGATDAAGKPSHFYCRVCRKDVSVLTHGPHEILRHYQGVKHFIRDQRLRLETPGWRVLEFEGNPLSESELERRRKSILRGPLVVRDGEYPFAEDLIIDESGAPDTTLPVVAKVSSLIETLRLGGPYELVSQLWSQFTLIASRVNIAVAWSRDEVLVGIVLLVFTTHACSLAYWCFVLSDHLEWHVPRLLARVFGWVKSHGRLSIEFEERSAEVWIMVRTWERSTFRRVCVAVLNRFSSNTTLEATVLGKILDAAGPDAAVVSLHGGPHVLAEAFAGYLGSGYRTKLIEYPTFDLRLLKRCLQRTASVVFGSLDPFSLTEFIVNRLKGAESRDWMASRPALRKAIITHDLSMPEIVDVVANIVGVWPLIVSYLKETGRKDEGDSLVVRSFLLVFA